jgi:hypothetical protein
MISILRSCLRMELLLVDLIWNSFIFYHYNTKIGYFIYQLIINMVLLKFED